MHHPRHPRPPAAARPPASIGLFVAVIATSCAHAPKRPDPHVRDSLLALAPGLDPRGLDAALQAHACGVHARLLAPPRHQPLLAIIDFSLPSTERRLWVFDLGEPALLAYDWVSHGAGSGENIAQTFSDIEGSHQTSLGAYATAETYIGKHGLSLRLDGLEPGLNQNARPRDIVVHGAPYVSEAHIAEHGRLGRSWGCPALRPELAADLIPTLANGALLFAYHPNSTPPVGAQVPCTRPRRTRGD